MSSCGESAEAISSCVMLLGIPRSFSQMCLLLMIAGLLCICMIGRTAIKKEMRDVDASARCGSPPRCWEKVTMNMDDLLFSIGLSSVPQSEIDGGSDLGGKKIAPISRLPEGFGFNNSHNKRERITNVRCSQVMCRQ